VESSKDPNDQLVIVEHDQFIKNISDTFNVALKAHMMFKDGFKDEQIVINEPSSNQFNVNIESVS
jgi:hypothetical protein